MGTGKSQCVTDVHEHGINFQKRDIYLHSFISNTDEGEPGVDYRQSITFTKNLHALDTSPYKPILVHMQSIGGCWDNGMAIYNSMQFARSYLTVLGYAQASSMSGILLQAASLRVLMPDCHFMLHYGWSGGASNHPIAAHSEAAFQVNACKRMIQILAERAVFGPYFNKKKSTTVDQACRFFEKKLREKVDWYLSAEDAVEYGLADAVLGSNEYPDVHSLRE